METVAHRRRAIRDQIVDREVRRLELMQRTKRAVTATEPRREGRGLPPEPR